MNHINDYKQFFNDKKITLIGLGLLGRGLGDARFLARCGADLIVTDLKSRSELRKTLEKLKKYRSIKYTLGGHKLTDFRGRDMILKAAGVPLDSPYIKEAKKNKIPIEMDESLFLKLSPKGIRFVGVTGTRGKTTVTTMIYEILRRAKSKLGWKHNVYIAGNIQGVATLPLLTKVRAGDIVVLELSSWQLQGFGEAKISPHIAVFINFLDDHLNYYGSRKKYFKDKSYIYKYQKRGDFLVTPHGLLKKIHADTPTLRSKTIHPKKLPPDFKLRVPGEHSRKNAALALEVVKHLGVNHRIVKEALEKFAPVPGRQELVKKTRGVEIYNDTTSTTQESVVAALESLGQEKKVILIMGGSDKGLAIEGMMRAIKKHCKSVLCIAGTGTDRVKKYLRKNKVREPSPVFIKSKVGETALEIALKTARAQARAGDRIVFSPGFTSFGMFKNEYDRGDKFNKILAKIWP